MSRAAALVVALAVAVTTPARAQPQPQPQPTAMVDVAAAEAQLDVGLRLLVEHLEEPTGLRAPVDLPALGLQANDVVRAINGQPAIAMPDLPPDAPSLVYLDVRRGAQAFTIRIEVRPARRTAHALREDLQAILDQPGRFEAALQPVERNGAATGVQVSAGAKQLLPRLGLVPGDVVRKVDGKRVTTETDVRTALTRARTRRQLTLEVERVDQPVAVTLFLADPKPSVVAATVAKIKQRDELTYELPRDVLAALAADPMPFARGARIVPAMRHGKPEGFKLYAVRPSSIFATLGLQNGDTVRAVNGLAVETAERALEVYQQLRGAKSFEVDILRRGKPLTLRWRIR